MLYSKLTTDELIQAQKYGLLSLLHFLNRGIDKLANFKRRVVKSRRSDCFPAHGKEGHAIEMVEFFDAHFV